MAILDIIGPVMIGPSSSHTAGAARIGYFAREIFGDDFDFVQIDLFNSFADTGKGHGTDIAIIGGLLGFEPDDLRILHSFEIAKENRIKFKINWNTEEDEDLPPNTAKITFFKNDTQFFIIGNSVGGGKVEISIN
jgi:L-serine dehydratase